MESGVFYPNEAPGLADVWGNEFEQLYTRYEREGTEVVEYTAADEVAVCNLASIALPKYVVLNEHGHPQYDHQKLFEVTKVVTKNLNKIIDLFLFFSGHTLGVHLAITS